ncbi:MAG: glycosyltransferase [Parvularculaceae bacterium]
MKIAYFVNQYPGISHSFIRREIQALERAGVTVRRFAVRPSRDGVIADEDIEEARQTRCILTSNKGAFFIDALVTLVAAPARSMRAFVRALKFGGRSEAGLFRHLIYFVEALVLARWMRRKGLRHVHAHFGTNSATVALLAGEMAGATFSMTVHGPEEFDKPALISLTEKIERSAFTAAVSSYGASQLMRLVDPLYWDRIKIVRCGIEKTFFQGSETPSPRGRRFVSVGRLSPQKGQMVLVEAVSRLQQDGADVQVVIIGDGPMREALEESARAFGVDGDIHFAGWRTPAEVRAEIEAARIFVLPSFAEGLPVSIMEAFVLERPVISTYVAGIPELVRPGENGWLAPAGDAEALANAMRAALAASDEEIAAMGRAGKERAAAMHDIDIEAAKLKAHFATALGSAS